MNTNNKKKVIVAMSGGVDSSVAAKLLSDKGYEVVGIFLHFWKPSYAPRGGASEGKPFSDKVKFTAHSFSEGQEGKEFENKCCSTEALMDARRVCQKIGIPLYTLNFVGDFKKEVVDYFLSEYGKGNTPNPCVRCNKFVKLGLLIKYAKKLGFDFVASGHYAIVKKTKKQKNKKTICELRRAKDKDKDQSYFLYNFTQDQLKHLIFPLGEFTKEETRKMAKKFKLPVAEKKDSQEVCFVPEKNHNEFLKRYLKLRPGKIKIMDGKIVGEHKGLPLYTIGQRKGVEIGGTGPYYAAKFDYKKNILYVVNDANDPALFSDKLIAKNVNWISGAKPKLPLKCEAVIRYRHKAAECVVQPLPTLPFVRGGHKKFPLLAKEGGGGGYLVQFSEPQRAATPGQSIVFYKGNEVLGGGIIDRSN
jgi:tRNA-specific 2-thiouridylase